MKAYQTELDGLCNVIHAFERRFWTPATSSNFSLRVSGQDPAVCAVTQSGKDKSSLTSDDFMLIDGAAEWRRPESAKPSAESLIHTCLYDWKAEIQSVLHTHSVASSVISQKTESASLVFQGYEIQKAFSGISSHESEVECPIFENSQDMFDFSKRLKEFLSSRKTPLHGFLIRGHGLYAWGGSVAEAKRSVEAWEFLFQCRLEEQRF